MQKVLVCDDEHDITESIAIHLKNDGYKVFKCYNGKEAIECLKKNHLDLVIMDIMMPGDNGIKTVEKIRDDSDVPVIFLSAKSEDEDKILGLETGADDYMTKPYNPRELKARVRSLLKRSSITTKKSDKDVYATGGLKLNKNTKTVTLSGRSIKLTSIEYNILLYFMRNMGKVLSSNDIYKEVWNQETAFNIGNSVAVHIRHLRKKIEKNSKAPKYIKVVWGIGYKMEDLSK